MSVFRIEKTNNFTVMSNYHFKEKKMSLKAKGLLSLMLSLPEDWDYSIAGLVTLSADGESSVRSALKELEEFGYLERNRIYENGRVADWEYIIYEKPKCEILDVENQQLENLILENHGQLNTNKLNTKELNTKIIKNNANAEIKPKKKLSKKDKVYGIIEKKCIEYEFNDNVINEIYKFYDTLIDAKKVINEYTIDATFRKLENVSDDIKLKAIQLSLDKGYKSIDPDWLKNNTSAEHLSITGTNEKDHNEYIKKYSNNKNLHKF